MNNFSKDIAGAIGDLARQFGADAVPTYQEGCSHPIELEHSIISEEADGEQHDAAGDRTNVRTLMLTLITDETHPQFCGVSLPLDSATIGYEGLEYSIISITRPVFGITNLKLRRAGLVENARPGFRKRFA